MIKRILCPLLLTVGLFAPLPAQTLEAGKQLFLKGEYANAKPIFEKQIKQRPNDASLNHWLGVCYFETGESDQAEKFLKLAARRNIQESYRYLSLLYMEEYRFDEAKKSAATYAAFRNLTELQKEEAHLLQKRSETGVRMLNGIEDVVVLDSIIVERDAFLKAYRLSEESGSIAHFASFFGKTSTTLSAVYQNERRDRILFSKLGEETMEQIYTSSLANGQFGEEVILPHPINSTEASSAYPFLLSDGMTIYFASDRPESIGGLDIFVSRYNPESGNYLRPENVGFPFNSAYNDFMMAIDELNGFGWFASDRFQPEGKAILYTFLYNESKQSVRSDEEGYLRTRASLRSIRSSWVEGESYAADMARLKSIGTTTKMKDDGFFFVVNNEIQYNRFDQFRNKQAVELFKQSQQLRLKLQQATEMLDRDRRALPSLSGSQSGSAHAKLLQLEQQVQRMEEELTKAERQIRTLELSNRGR